jgi:tRNA(Ser,Leu) C12 N-acetylase TAN1
VAPSEFRNVLLVHVDNVENFTRSLDARVAAEPGVMNLISRVIPSTRTFNFQTPAEFDERAGEIVLKLAPGLAGKRFHIRIHRRGFKHRLSSHDEEQHLSKVALEALAAAGTPAAITFEDPDIIIAIEMVGQRAAVSLWTREQLRQYPFLRLD